MNSKQKYLKENIKTGKEMENELNIMKEEIKYLKVNTKKGKDV